MGPDEAVGSTRSGHRSRNMAILGGLALVLVAGVILAGVFPTGDRAGTTATDPSASATPSATAPDDPIDDPTTDPSASATPSATATATATDDPIDDPTTDPSVSPSSTATDDPTEEPVAVTTCAEGGACVVGDIGPGGGLVFYNAGSAQDGAQYIEMAPKDWDDVCDSYLLGCSWSDGLSAAASYRGGGLADWVVPSKPVLSAMYSFKSSITDESQYYLDTSLRWSSDQKTKHDAWCQYFDTGKKASCYKPGEYSVRVVRSF